MEYRIRQEQKSDFEAVEQLVEAAFKTMPYSSHTEHLIVKRIRKSLAFIPELSLVAVEEQQIIGHILLSKVSINKELQNHESLSLAPVSVSPEWQGKGIGNALINTAHKKAASMGFPWVVLIGHKDYYPRFGYQKSIDYDIRFPFDSPPENCMVKALQPNGLNGVSGMVQYPKAFFG